jgi:L-lysine exporter family protein LysE/ArgO
MHLKRTRKPMHVSMYAPSFVILFQGFLLCASLIVAVGPQNLFILQQGLRRRHLFITAGLCALCDLLLISLGVGGIGTAIAASQPVMAITTLGGATFLFGYGVRSFRAAWHQSPMLSTNTGDMGQLSWQGTVVATLSFSLLNPGAYIDTLLMIGATSSRYPLDERVLFGAGAALASCLWFFSLTYGSSRLQPLFRHSAVWRTLELISGCVMVGIAASLAAAQSHWFW